MNPFELHGFSFLAFYLATGIAVFWSLHRWLRHRELGDDASAPATPTLTDPYLIAYLRAGENEALRVATVALLDRGLLKADGDKLKTRNASAVDTVRRPIERAILRHYATQGEAHEIFKDDAAKRACAEYAKSLKQSRMIADASVYAGRTLPVLIALGLMIVIAWTKVNIAFSQGRHNVGFLIALAVIFGIVALVIWRRRLTGRGVAMMADLRDLFSRLKGRAKTLRAGGATNEAALLMAVFGLSALPASGFPFLEKLYPAKSSDGSGCGSSSSCSSGSSCGGGCGGGGCGG